MARAQIGETDSLPASRTYLNANIAKDDALQTATGIAESGTNIGAIGTLPTGAVASTDTLRNAVLKLEGRTPVNGPKHGVDSLRTARELGANYDYKTAVEGIEGTTAVDISGASAQEYPDADGIYTLEVVRSGGGGGSAGRTIVVTATKGFSRWVRIKSEGTWGAWIQADGVSPANLVTQNDTGRSAYSIAAEEWRTRLSGGLYAASYTLAQATTYGMPLDGLPTGSVGWLIEILRTGALTATARVSGTYTHTLESSARVHTFTAQLTRADEAAVSWTVGTWQGVSPVVFPSRSVRTAALYERQWALTVPDEFEETPDVLPVRSGNRWSGSVSALSLAPAVVGETYYVDPVTGSNSDAGTAAAPFRTLNYAMNLADAGRVYVAPAVYFASTGWGAGVDARPSANIRVEKWHSRRPGEVIMSSARDLSTLGWTQYSPGTYPNVYRGDSTATIVSVIDLTIRGRYDSFRSYQLVATEAQCNTVAGSWFYDAVNDYIYVHPATGGSPHKDILICAESAPGYNFGTNEIYMDGITWVGVGPLFHNNTGATGGKLVARNCGFVNCYGNGITVLGIESFVAEDCRAIDNGADGIYTDKSSTGDIETVKRAEIRTIGVGNGWRVSPANSGNGTTAHNGTESVLIDCYSGENVGPCFADVVNTKTWLVGCRAGQSAAALGGTSNAGFVTTLGGSMWLYECDSTVNENDLVLTGEGFINVDQSSYRTSSAAVGGIRAYTQL